MGQMPHSDISRGGVGDGKLLSDSPKTFNVYFSFEEK